MLGEDAQVDPSCDGPFMREARVQGLVVVEARLRIRHWGCITESLTGNAHATQISGDQHAIFVMHGENERQVDAFVNDTPESIEDAIIVSRTPKAVVVRGRNPRSGIVSTIFAFGCSILWPAVFRDGLEQYTIVAPGRDRLDALVDRLADMGEVRLERIADVDADALDVSVPLADVTSGLTERQLAVLRRAIERGYYAQPRRVSADALAKDFGIARTTLQEHLRKAEQRVLERFASVLASHPVLAARDVARGRHR